MSSLIHHVRTAEKCGRERDESRECNEEYVERIDEEKLVVENLLNEPKEVLTRGQSISDKVARFGGSWSFIISFSVILLVWIVFNIYAANKFDPFPFILMNLVLSTIAALQAPVIMMSQNRQDAKDRVRADLDYQVNLKAEVEIMDLHRKLDRMKEELIDLLAQIHRPGRG